MCERNFVLFCVVSPLPVIDDGIEGRKLVRRIIDPAQHTDAWLDKEVAGFGIRKTKGAVRGMELLDRAGERVMDQRIVIRAPGREISVPFIGEARDNPGPVKPSRTVITFLDSRFQGWRRRRFFE